MLLTRRQFLTLAGLSAIGGAEVLAVAGRFLRQESQRWKPEGAVFTAPSWASPGVLEPTVRELAGGGLGLWFRGGGVHGEGSGGEQIGYATGSDGRSWTDHGAAILGGGVGGEAHPTICPHMRQFPGSSTFYLYYTDTSSKKVKCAASSDGISGFTISDTGLSLPTNCIQFGNAHVVKIGSTYHLYVDADNTVIGAWVDYYATSSSPTSGFTWQNGTNPISPRVDGGAGGYGGGMFIPPDEPTFDGIVHAWFTAGDVVGFGSAGSDIWRGWTTDMVNWTVVDRIVQHSGSGYEIDQVADACVLEANGESLMYLDADDNTTGISAIELLSFPGTRAQLVSGR